MKAAAALPIAGFYLLYFATVGVTLPFLPAYLASLGLHATQVGTLLAIGPAVTLIAPPLWGHLADRLGRPDLVLQTLAVGACLGFAPLLVATDFGWIAATLCLYAFFNASITPVIDGLALHRVHNHGGHFARLRLWGSVGFIAAATAFGRFVHAVDRRAVLVPLALMAGE